MAFDVEGALKAGYTQEEINQFLSQQPQEKPSFDVDGALKAGYTQEQIDEFLVTPQQPTPPQQPVTPEPVATQPKPVDFDIEGALAAGYTQEEINQFLLAQGQPKRPEDVGFFEGVVESGKQAVDTFSGMATGYDVAASALKGDIDAVSKKMVDAKAEQAQQALEAIPTLTAADIQRIFEEKGIISAGTQVPNFMVQQIIKNGPQMIPPLLAGIGATALAAPTGPFAPLIGTAAGVITYGLQQFGNFMERQALERSAPEDIDVGKAGLWAAVTAPIGYFVDRFALGLTGGGRQVAKEVLQEIAERKAGKVAAVKAGAAAAGTQGVRGLIAEAPTEVLEQMAERYQAGLDLGSEEAKQEYFEAFWSAAAVGGGLGSASSAFTSYRDYQAAKKTAEETPDTNVDESADKKPSRETIIKDEFEKLKAKVAEEKAKEETSKKEEKKAIIETTPTDVQLNPTGVLDEATLTSFGIPKKSQKKLIGLDFNNEKDVETFDAEVQNLTNLKEDLINEYKLKLSDEAIKDGRPNDKTNRISYEVSSGPYNAISEGAGTSLGSSVLGYTTDAGSITGRIEEPTDSLEEALKTLNKRLIVETLGYDPDAVTDEVADETIEEATTPPVVEEVNEVTEDEVTPTLQEQVTPEELDARNLAAQLNALDPGNPLVAELQDPFVTEEIIREANAEIKARKDKKLADDVEKQILDKNINLEPDEYYSVNNFVSPEPEIISTTKTNKRLGDVFNNLKENHLNKMPFAYRVLLRNLETLPGVKNAKYRVEPFVTKPDANGAYYPSTNSVQIAPDANIKTIMHESVHVATVAEMRRQITTKVGKDGKPLVDPVSGMIQYVGKTQAAKNLITIYETAVDVGASRAEANREAPLAPGEAVELTYGFTDIYEFIAESFSNPQFQKILVTIPSVIEPSPLSRLSNMWTDFVNSVKSLLKLRDISNTLLNDVISVSQDLFKGPDQSVFDMVFREDKAQPLLEKKKKETKADYDALLKKAVPKVEEKKKKPTGKYQEPGDDPTGSIAKYIRNFRTKAFSFDLALNQAILKSMRMQGKAKDVIAKAFYMLDAGQAVRSDDVAYNFLVNGKIDYNPTNAKVTVTKSPNSFKAIEDKIAAMAKYYGVKFEDMQQYASAAFVAKRIKGLKASNTALKKKVASLLRKGKDAQARKLMKSYKLIHLTPAQEKAGMEFFNKFDAKGYSLNEVFTMWNAVRAETLNFAVESGLYSEEDAQALLEVMDYVPFYREAQLAARKGPKESTRGLLDTATEKFLKGSYEQVNNVFDNMERWISYTIQKGVKNQAAINKILVTKAYMDNEIKAIDEGQLGRAKHPVTVWFDGKKKSFDFEQEIFQKAFTGMDPLMIPEMAIFAPFVNILRQNIVLNPVFSLLQIPQDAYAAMLTSQVRYPVALPLQVMKEIVLTPLGLSKARQQLKTTSVVGRLDYSKQIEQYEREFKQEKRKLGPILKTGKKVLDTVLYPFSALSMASDNVIRQAVYSQTMLETNDARLATMRAAEIINFRRTGSSRLVNVMRQVSPFINANLQALNVVGGTLLLDGISPKTKREAAVSTLNTMMQTIPLMLIYSALMSDDEEYQKMDPVYRDNSLLIPGFLTGDIKGWTLPLRPDLFTLVSKTLPENLFQQLVKDTQDPTKTKEAFYRAFASGVAFPTPFPSAVRPVAEVMFNYDLYRDRPIIGRGLEDLPTELQFSAKNTTQFAITLSKASGGLLAPVEFEQLLRGYFGYSAGLVNLVFENIFADINGMVLPFRDDREALRKIPGFSRLLSSEEGSRNLNDFYELRELVNKEYKKMKGYQKFPFLSGGDAVTKIYAQESKRKLIDLNEAMEEISKELNVLRTYENEVLTNSNMTPETKQSELKRIAEMRQGLLGFEIDTPEKARRHIEQLRRAGGL